MIDLLFATLANLLTVQHMGFMTVGVLLGLVIGVLPGVGGIAGLSLLLPFVYGMDQTSALAMMIGLLAIVPTADTFTSILMGIPGSSASQATVLDGFPLARQGQAARALSAAFAASLIGGLFGAFLLTGAVLVAAPIILSFGSAELFMLTLFGLSMVGVLSGANMVKGVASASLGLAFGLVGAAPATSEARMDFGSLYLLDGIPLVIVALGVFALPEILDLLRSGGAIAQQGTPLGRGWFQGVRDTFKSFWLTLRCSGIGALIGAIPGIGGSVVDWIAYGHVVQTSKDKSQFGKGDIRGVIAPEAANNATAGGALLPTLLFGIPGSGSMAIFLAAMILLGLQPGPNMATSNLGTTYTIIWSLAIANVIGTICCIALAPGIAKLTAVRYPLIAPFMIMVISFAAFQATRDFMDLFALLLMGLLGIFLRRFGWSRPAFLIGFVLALGGERYLYQAVQFYGWDFLTRPIVLIIGAITVVSIWAGVRRSPGGSSVINTEGATETAVARTLWPQIVFAVFVLGVFVFAFQQAMQVSFLAQVFPLSVAIVGGLAVLLIMVQLLRGPVAAGSANFDGDANATDSGPWPWLGWFVGFIAGVALVGFFAALAIFFVAFLRIVAKSSWAQTLVLTASATGLMLVMGLALNLVFPGGLAQEMFDLPWPFR